MAAELSREIPNFDGVVEDDQYSDDPDRKQLYFLKSASSKIDTFFKSITIVLTHLPNICREVLRAGELSHEITFLVTAPEALPSDSRQLAQVTIQSIRDITNEKGFRFNPALYTPREHQEIGSSGFAGLGEIDPNIPVPILERRLNPKDAETMTIEEVDRARRLIGMTRLDLATGRVTNEIDQEAAADSYFFLAPERREKIIRLEQEQLAQIELLSQQGLVKHQTSRNLLVDLTAYAHAELTTPEFRKRYLEAVANTSQSHTLNLDEPIKALRRLAFECGYWDYMLTPQEILLRVDGVADQRYLANPYIPLAIQDGRDISEIASLRQGERSIIVNTNLLEYEMPFGIRLEELDNQGNTIKSPTLLSYEDGETEISDDYRQVLAPQLNFPLARPEDWFYKEEAVNPK